MKDYILNFLFKVRLINFIYHYDHFKISLNNHEAFDKHKILYLKMH